MSEHNQPDVFGDYPVTPRYKHKIKKVRGEVACSVC